MDTTERYMKNLSDAIKAEDAKRKKPSRRKSKKAAYSKPQSIILLQEDYTRWRLKQGEECVQPRTPVFSDEKANDLTKAIVAHIYCNGGFAARVNSTGTYKHSEGRYILSGSRNGMADVNACIRGRHVQVEVKIGSDKPRDAQLQVQMEVEAAGGVYIFVKSFDDYLNKIKGLFI